NSQSPQSQQAPASRSRHPREKHLRLQPMHRMRCRPALQLPQGAQSQRPPVVRHRPPFNLTDLRLEAIPWQSNGAGSVERRWLEAIEGLPVEVAGEVLLEGVEEELIVGGGLRE